MYMNRVEQLNFSRFYERSMAQVVCIQRGHNIQPLSCFHFCILFPWAQALWPELFFNRLAAKKTRSVM